MNRSKNKPFERILIIMFENQYRSYVLENDYFRRLASQGIDMANYFGVMHPSQTNYIASIAGELCNITDDDAPQTLLQQQTVVDLLEESGLSWKAYMDSYIPQAALWKPNMTPQNQYPYVIKHNPFSSFEGIVRSETRWNKIDNESQFWQDVLSQNLPQYAWFTPNMWNDGHYLVGSHEEPHNRAPALVDQAAIWLESFFDVLQFPGPDSHLPSGTLVVVTFDEADFLADYDEKDKYTYDGPNQIYTVLLGDMISAGKEEEGFNHYSLLKTIQKNFRLGSLKKNDEDANWFKFLWGKKFEWRSPTETPLAAVKEVAVAEYQGLLFVVYQDIMGELVCQIFDGEDWLDSVSIGQAGQGRLALASSPEQLILVYTSTEQMVAIMRFDADRGWQMLPEQIVDEGCGDFAITAVPHTNTFMLAWSDAQGDLYSRQCIDNQWDTHPTPVGHQTDGFVALTALGASLFLICKAPGSDEINVISYNTADFNVTTIENSKWSGPYDNAVKDQWSPSAFPVAHFAHGPNPQTPGEDEPLLQPYQARDRAAVATMDGVIHLVHPTPHEPLVFTETFSISGVLTPKLPVSYRKSDEKKTSNGYGTLAQAGWSTQTRLEGVYNEAGESMAMCRFGDEVVLLYLVGENGRLHIVRGSYS